MFRLTWAVAAIGMSSAVALADPFDLYEIYEETQNYNGQAFQTSLECIDKTIVNFLASEETTLEPNESWVKGISAQYDTIVHFSGAHTESEMVTIDWMEVLKREDHPQKGSIFQSSSHINFDTSSLMRADHAAQPFQTNAYNGGHEIEGSKNAKMLDRMLRDCPIPNTMALS